VKIFPTPLWAELAPFYVADEEKALVASGEDERPIATAGDPNDRAEEVDCSIADLIVGAPAYALILRLVAGGATLAPDPEGELILTVPIDGYVEPVAMVQGGSPSVEVFEEIPISVDEYGLPILPGAIYRQLARIIGWPALPAPGGAG
jgi:hypothetical protein